MNNPGNVIKLRFMVLLKTPKSPGRGLYLLLEKTVLLVRVGGSSLSCPLRGVKGVQGSKIYISDFGLT